MCHVALVRVCMCLLAWTFVVHTQSKQSIDCPLTEHFAQATQSEIQQHSLHEVQGNTLPEMAVPKYGHLGTCLNSRAKGRAKQKVPGLSGDPNFTAHASSIQDSECVVSPSKLWSIFVDNIVSCCSYCLYQNCLHAWTVLLKDSVQKHHGTFATPCMQWSEEIKLLALLSSKPFTVLPAQQFQHLLQWPYCFSQVSKKCKTTSIIAVMYSRKRNGVILIWKSNTQNVISTRTSKTVKSENVNNFEPISIQIPSMCTLLSKCCENC